MVHAVSDSVQQSDARDAGTYEVTLTYLLVITRHLFLRLMLAIPYLHALCISQSCIAALPVWLHCRAAINIAMLFHLLVSAGSWMWVHWSICDPSVYAQLKQQSHDVIHHQ